MRECRDARHYSRVSRIYSCSLYRSGEAAANAVNFYRSRASGVNNENRIGMSTTSPANGGEKFNHDAGLEREAEVICEKALQGNK